MAGRKKNLSIYIDIAIIVILIPIIAYIGYKVCDKICRLKVISDDSTPRIMKDRGSDCPSLDELLSEEFTADSIKMDAPLDVVEKKNSAVQIKKKEKKEVLKIEKEPQESTSNGIRIILHYDDRDTLLRRAELYGLTLNYKASVPYYFVLNKDGERLYFNSQRIFEKFIQEIGGEEVFTKARKEISVRLVSGERIEVMGYQ